MCDRMSFARHLLRIEVTVTIRQHYCLLVINKDLEASKGEAACIEANAYQE